MRRLLPDVTPVAVAVLLLALSACATSTSTSGQLTQAQLDRALLPKSDLSGATFRALPETSPATRYCHLPAPAGEVRLARATFASGQPTSTLVSNVIEVFTSTAAATRAIESMRSDYATTCRSEVTNRATLTHAVVGSPAYGLASIGVETVYTLRAPVATQRGHTPILKRDGYVTQVGRALLEVSITCSSPNKSYLAHIMRTQIARYNAALKAA